MFENSINRLGAPVGVGAIEELRWRRWDEKRGLVGTKN